MSKQIPSEVQLVASKHDLGLCSKNRRSCQECRIEFLRGRLGDLQAENTTQAERIAALEAEAAKECDCCGYTKGTNLAEYRKLMRYGSELAFERLEAELSTLRESMRAGSLLRKVGEPLPKGCYCTLGKCTAPRPEWCRDSEKRDYKPPEDSSERDDGQTLEVER